MSASVLSSPRLHFRTADAADIPVLQDLAERTWRACYAAILPPGQMDYMLTRMYAPVVIAKELEKGVIWELASDHGGPIGFHSCGFDFTERSLKLSKLYVLPEEQGRGYGKAMLRRVQELAESFSAERIWLQVNKSNATAIRAYERAGYQIQRAAVFDIGGGFVMDDFIMALAIPSPTPLSPKDGVLAGA